MLMTFATDSKRLATVSHDMSHDLYMTRDFCVSHDMSHDLQNVLSKMHYMFELTEKRPVYWGPVERNPLKSIHERE